MTSIKFQKTSLGSDMPNHLLTPRPQTDGALFQVHKQPIALDRFTLHDVGPTDNSGKGFYIFSRNYVNSELVYLRTPEN